jgi:hypothetical protein
MFLSGKFYRGQGYILFLKVNQKVRFKKNSKINILTGLWTVVMGDKKLYPVNESGGYVPCRKNFCGSGGAHLFLLPKGTGPVLFFGDPNPHIVEQRRHSGHISFFGAKTLQFRNSHRIGVNFQCVGNAPPVIAEKFYHSQCNITNHPNAPVFSP